MPAPSVPSLANHLARVMDRLRARGAPERAFKLAERLDPKLFEPYSAPSIARALAGAVGAKPKWDMYLYKPANFEELAWPLTNPGETLYGGDQAVVDALVELSRTGFSPHIAIGGWANPKYPGFTDLPELGVFRSDVVTTPKVIHHEGRHTSRALPVLGHDQSLMLMHPMYGTKVPELGDLTEQMITPQGWFGDQGFMEREPIPGSNVLLRRVVPAIAGGALLPWGYGDDLSY